MTAWDPVKQKLAWSIPQKTFWNAGTLTTAGNLLFQGRSDGQFLAYDASNGETLWSFNAGLGISSPPITYKIGDRQYLALLVGFGGGYSAIGGKDAHELGWSYKTHTRRLIVFSLDGKAEVPDLPPPHVPKPLVDPQFKIDAKLAEAGAGEYGKCSGCHGWNMYASGYAPELRSSIIPTELESFRDIVKNGARVDKGMPAFPEITDEQLKALQHYIRRRAAETLPEYETWVNQ